MSVEVLIPFRGGCPHREAALDWVQRHHTWPVRVSLGPEPWCKALAVMPAIERSRADVIVVADADCWCDGLGAAVAAVEAGAPWAIPHKGVHRLTAESTCRVMAGEPWETLPTVERPYRGVAGGGFVVAPRETLLEVPIDPRFVGWGQEDSAHGLALRTLAGDPWRGLAPLIHLWHPPQSRDSRKWGSAEGRALYRRYRAAANRPAAMRALIEEATNALSSDYS